MGSAEFLEPLILTLPRPSADARPYVSAAMPDLPRDLKEGQA